MSPQSPARGFCLSALTLALLSVHNRFKSTYPHAFGFFFPLNWTCTEPWLQCAVTAVPVCPDCPRQQRMWRIALGCRVFRLLLLWCCYWSWNCLITFILGTYILQCVPLRMLQSVHSNKDVAMFWQFECKKGTGSDTCRNCNQVRHSHGKHFSHF